MIEVRGRARRYINRVVVLSPKDAFLVCTVLDKQAMEKALRSSNEGLIDSLRAISLARDDWATFIDQRKTAANRESKQDLDKWLTPVQIADELSVTRVAIEQAQGRRPLENHPSRLRKLQSITT
jgi:hypothetical protein